MMDIRIILTKILEDKTWGFSSILNGRNLDIDTKQEIVELLHKDWIEATDTDTIVLLPASENNAVIFSLQDMLDCYHSAFSSGRIAISNEKEEMEKYFRETLKIEI